jgi:hypothetical protein
VTYRFGRPLHTIMNCQVPGRATLALLERRHAEVRALPKGGTARRYPDLPDAVTDPLTWRHDTLGTRRPSYRLTPGCLAGSGGHDGPFAERELHPGFGR